jgi:hypothetical protein
MRYPLTFFLSLVVTLGFSQHSLLKDLTIKSKAGVITSTDNTPFLLRANQYGLVPVEPHVFYLNTALVKPYDSTGKTFDFGYGFEPHINVASKSQFLLPEAYVKAKWKAVEIYAGRRREVMGYVDTVGTMGSYIWSGNALPIPKIDIGIREFTSFTKNGLLAFKGNFAHGWFGKGDSVQNVLLHQKSLYLRLGKPSWNIKLIAGFNHQAQWGGKPTVPFKDEISGQFITTFGTNFQDFIRVFNGKSVGNATGLGWDEVEGVAGNEAGNRIGNHLGSIDIGLDILLNPTLKMKIYRQSIFEDGSLFYLNNITDGLTGLAFSGSNHFNLVLEYLDTRSQGGSIYYGNIPELRGRDNYFNNGIYKDAWTYKGNTIGTPLLNPYSENPDTFLPIKKTNKNYIYNNRVQAFNAKANYLIKEVSLITQFVYSKNLGHFVLPINKNSVSLMQTARFRCKGLSFAPRLAVDLGDYYPASLGVDLSVTRSW